MHLFSLARETILPGQSRNVSPLETGDAVKWEKETVGLDNERIARVQRSLPTADLDDILIRALNRDSKAMLVSSVHQSQLRTYSPWPAGLQFTHTRDCHSNKINRIHFGLSLLNLATN